MRWWCSAAVLGLAFYPTSFSTQRDAGSNAAVAVVLANGRLLPIAVHSRDGWRPLAWPTYGLDDTPPSTIPPTVAEIPAEWYVPLAALPQTWRLAPIDGVPRVIRIRAPARWEAATIQSVGLATDYGNQLRLDYEADGVAVSGDIEVLPTSRYNSASSAWREIVRTFAADFAKEEQADARHSHPVRRTPSAAALIRQLPFAEIGVWRVRGAHEYLYFDGRRSVLRGSRCVVEKYYRGLVTRSERQLRRAWISVTDDGCEDPPKVTEIVGGVRVAGKDWLIVQNWGDDWQDFDVLDPADSKSKLGGVLKNR